MKVLLLAIIFQGGAYKVMGTNDKTITASIERVSMGTFKLKTEAKIGECDIQPMDGNLLPAFKFFQYADTKMFTTKMMIFGKVDLNIFLQCQVL